MSDLALFWSYVHEDDNSNHQRITSLATLVRDGYEFRTGETIKVFVDKTGLEWGVQWQLRLDEALRQTTFLVPVVTPRYIQSDACRSELLNFVAVSRGSGIEELVLPILYAKPRPFEGEQTDDEVIGILKGRQWIDWTDIRLEDESSSAHRRAVDNLVSRLIDATRRSEAVETQPSTISNVGAAVTAQDAQEDADDDAPGQIELMADAAEALPRVTRTLEEFRPAMEAITGLLNEKMDHFRRTKDTRLQQRILHDLGLALDSPVSKVEDLGSAVYADMLVLHPAILGMIKLGRDFPEIITEESSSTFTSIIELDSVAQEAFQPMASLANTIDALSGLSRELRRPFRRLSAAIRQIVDIRGLLTEWRENAESLLRAP